MCMNEECHAYWALEAIIWTLDALSSPCPMVAQQGSDNPLGRPDQFRYKDKFVGDLASVIRGEHSFHKKGTKAEAVSLLYMAGMLKWTRSSRNEGHTIMLAS